MNTDYGKNREPREAKVLVIHKKVDISEEIENLTSSKGKRTKTGGERGTNDDEKGTSQFRRL